MTILRIETLNRRFWKRTCLFINAFWCIYKSISCSPASTSKYPILFTQFRSFKKYQNVRKGFFVQWIIQFDRENQGNWTKMKNIRKSKTWRWQNLLNRSSLFYLTEVTTGVCYSGTFFNIVACLSFSTIFSKLVLFRIFAKKKLDSCKLCTMLFINWSLLTC